jgi:hypothetical protein
MPKLSAIKLQISSVTLVGELSTLLKRKVREEKIKDIERKDKILRERRIKAREQKEER